MENVDKFLDKFQDRYFLNSLEKSERQELKDFIIRQNAGLLESCEEMLAILEQIDFPGLPIEYDKLFWKDWETTINKAKGE